MSYIYLVTNKVNGKQYVGQHHYEDEGIDEKYKGSGKLIKQAYQKYGYSNFTIDVLEYCTDSTIETRKKLSEARKGRKTKPMSEEARKKLSNALKGRVFSDEWKQNMSKSKIGKPNISSRKPVRQIDKTNNEIIAEWPCIQEAADSLGIAHADISRCCKGKARTCGGYKWEYKNE